MLEIIYSSVVQILNTFIKYTCNTFKLITYIIVFHFSLSYIYIYIHSYAQRMYYLCFLEKTIIFLIFKNGVNKYTCHILFCSIHFFIISKLCLYEKIYSFTINFINALCDLNSMLFFSNNT